MESNDDLGFNFGIYIDRAGRKAHTLLARKFKKSNVDLTPYQWTILNLVYKKGGKSQVEIAEKSLRNTASVSRIIDVMIKKKLIVREIDATDKRGYNIEITEFGSLTWNKAIPIIKEYRKKVWRGLDEKDYHVFRDLMARMSKNMED